MTSIPFFSRIAMLAALLATTVFAQDSSQTYAVEPKGAETFVIRTTPVLRYELTPKTDS